MLEHEERAAARSPTRTAARGEVFSPGYQASLDYVRETLEDSGYDVDIDMFNFPFWEETQPPVLNFSSVEPDKVYRPGDADDNDQDTADFITMANSRTINLDDARVVPTNDILDPPTGGSNSGCEPEDYPAAVAGAVALVQRGTCSFVQKWAVAEEAGAVGVIIYNEGNTPARQNPLFVDNGIDSEIAAVITSYALGNELLQAYKAGQNPTVDFRVFGQFTDRFLPQVLTETRTGDPDNVVVVGAHLGLGSGGARHQRRRQRHRDAADDGAGARPSPGTTSSRRSASVWFGAEENGLVGSQYYAHRLSDEEIAKIDVMLDYDMLASPNYVRFLYDGDGAPSSRTTRPGPEGSGSSSRCRRLVRRRRGSASEPRARSTAARTTSGSSTRGSRRAACSPGRRASKTPAQEAVYGGDAGSWYDPCYHQACDNLMTVLTGVPPWNAIDDGGAEGLDAGAPRPERQANALKMAGGALTGYEEMAGAASYATWYFSNVKHPFGAGVPRRSRSGRSRRAR